MKRSALLALVMTLLMLAVPGTAEEWSDYFTVDDEAAVSYDSALESYRTYAVAPEGTRIELVPAAADLQGDAALEVNAETGTETLVFGDQSSNASWTVEVSIVYAVLLRISTGVRPFLSEIRSKL